MAGAEILAFGNGQRQNAGRRHDPSAADDHRAVVQRRFGIKNIHEQLTGELGVHPYAFAFDHVPEAHAALNDDKRAHAQAGHFHAGHDHFLHAALLELAPTEQSVRAHFAQSLADVGLKNDHDEDEQ